MAANWLKILPILCLSFNLFAQNGSLDKMEDFTKKWTLPIAMPDGIDLAADLYMPVTTDSLVVTAIYQGIVFDLTLLRKNTQFLIYDSLNNQVNPDQNKLPLILIRTPYTKESSHEIAKILTTLGYAVLVSDNRGRYSSEGVYIPLYSDGWSKVAYHGNFTHSLDITPLGDPHSALKHEDGKNTINYILDSLRRPDGIKSVNVIGSNLLLSDGSISMWGGSALGYSQYQAAATMKNNISTPGLKGIMPIVATSEHFNTTLQHNGVFREALVSGWVQGQLFNNILFDPLDSMIQNDIHSNFDYGSIGIWNVLNLGVDEVSSIQRNGLATMYPNNLTRTDMDAKFAPININGESDANGSLSRYTNMELPIYHLTGWWDIFLEGQIETYQHIMKNTSPATQSNQKLVIGPWTHSLIATDSSGQIKYPNSVFDLLIGSTEDSDDNFTNLYEGEMAQWYRHILNYNSDHLIGEPKFSIPEDTTWQTSNFLTFRIPSSDYKLPYHKFLNFLNGFEDLIDVPIEINTGSAIINTVITISSSNGVLLGGKQFNNSVVTRKDFSTVPNIRLYVTGPMENNGTSNPGNYWLEADEFPIPNTTIDYPLFFHSNGTLDTIKPSISESHKTFIHDPNDPVFTIGGGNLTIRTPDDTQNNAGQMEYTNPNFSNYTMNRPDVLKFVSNPIQDSLMVLGYPVANIFMSSTPIADSLGLTSTDFFVRILDVYPDGREFFVNEGAINARAREYAKSRIGNVTKEDTGAVYSNIMGSQVYNYQFELAPMAYVFGQGHRVKILVSSSNHPRYQSNPNLPVNDGEFFRRQPNDGKAYTFNGNLMTPRKARQKMYFTPNQSSSVVFPEFMGLNNNSIAKQHKPNTINNLSIFPNPTKKVLNFKLKNARGTGNVNIINGLGDIVISIRSKDLDFNQTINIETLKVGVYFLEVESKGKVYKSEFIKF